MPCIPIACDSHFLPGLGLGYTCDPTNADPMQCTDNAECKSGPSLCECQRNFYFSHGTCTRRESIETLQLPRCVLLLIVNFWVQMLRVKTVICIPCIHPAKQRQCHAFRLFYDRLRRQFCRFVYSLSWSAGWSVS